MYCELVRGETRVRGPFQYDPIALARRLARFGFNPGMLPESLTGPIALDEYRLLPAIINKPPTSDHEDVTFDSRAVVNDEVIYTYVTTQRESGALRSQLKEKLAVRHALYELNYAEVRMVAIRADVEARVNASETLQQFKDGKINNAKWRGKNGKVSVDSTAEMQEIYDTIFNYLHHGFMAKEVAEDEIDAATDVELQSIDPVATFDNTLASLKGGTT